MSEAERSQEIFEFETIARMQQEGLTPDKRSHLNAPGKPVPELVAVMGSRFTAAGIETTTTLAEAAVGKELVLRELVKKYPIREENSWRPAPLLCKRFDLLDPFAGKAPPLPKPRSRTESFILLTNPVESNLELRHPPSQANFTQKSVIQDPKISESDERYGEELEQINEKIEPIPERPVDLYKAIFSDDSDDDDELAEPAQLSAHAGDAMKRAEAANTALNRLVAGDFLESLGKELGLEVPEITRPTGDRAEVKERDGGLGRSKNNDEYRRGESKLQSSAPVEVARDQRGFSMRHEKSPLGRQLHKNGTVVEDVYRRDSQQSSRGKVLQSDTNEALFGVKTRRLDVPDAPRRWGDDTSSARHTATGKEAKVSHVPSTVSRYDDTESESDSDKEKALAKQIRREERRLKREKEKRKHKHRKNHSSDKSGKTKKEKSREKERHHHRKRKRQRTESSSGTSSP